MSMIFVSSSTSSVSASSSDSSSDSSIGALNLGEDLSYFDGNTFLVHIPHKILKESVILTNVNEVSINEQVRNKIESLV